MTDEQIEHMVRRFLMWKLPEPWHPDNGISFKPPAHPNHPWPVGTNLFDYNQAEAMVRHMLEGLPACETSPSVSGENSKIAQGRFANG